MNKYRIHWLDDEHSDVWANCATDAVILAAAGRIEGGLSAAIHFAEIKKEGHCWELVHGEVNIKY